MLYIINGNKKQLKLEKVNVINKNKIIDAVAKSVISKTKWQTNSFK